MVPSFIVDVPEAEFEREVLERSRRTPVVVDFWAPWCGPCKQLAPVLEKLTKEHAGEFILAKVDIDAAPDLAASLGVRAVPTVVAFQDGQPVQSFQGVLPEAEVRRFLASILPSEADELVAEAETFRTAGNAEAARDRLHAALDLEARHPAALFGLARLDVEAGETEQALRGLERIEPGTPIGRDAQRLAAQLRTQGEGAGDLAALRARAVEAPDDPEAQLALGRALGAAAEYEAALEALLASVHLDPKHADDAARKAMIDLFDVLGAQHPLAQRFRAALARALFR